jgi:hypothetical protein
MQRNFSSSQRNPEKPIDIRIFKKIVSASRTMKSGLPYQNTLRAIHAMAVHDLGPERVGSLDLYPTTQGASPWTPELCKLDALQYQTRSEWQKHSRSAYRTAAKKGWLSLCCAHMPKSASLPAGTWTLKACKTDALKYSARHEWAKHSKSAYSAAHRNNWLSSCCAHMSPSKSLPAGTWTLEACKTDALKYATRAEWDKNSRGAYAAALKKGWAEICCQHMRKLNYWTLELCKLDALKYSSRYEWQKRSSAYQAASTNGWREICCAHMVTTKNKRVLATSIE